MDYFQVSNCNIISRRIKKNLRTVKRIMRKKMKINSEVKTMGYPEIILPRENCEIIIRSSWKQYMAAFIATLISMATGCVGSWSSPAVPVLMSNNSTILGGIHRLTEDEVSWIAALINLGALFGSIPAGPLSFHWGRKNFLLTLTIPLIVGWLLLIYNFDQVWFLYMGRFVCGISYGSLNVALPIYVNEIVRDDIRGRCGIFYDLMQCLGMLMVYGLGAVTDLYWITMSCLTVPIVFFFTFLWMPESPTYLVRNKKNNRAVESLRWLHGKNCNTQNEFYRIHLALNEGKENEGLEIATDSKWSLITHSKNFYNSLSKVTIKAVAISFFMFVLQRTCGGTMVLYYTEPMLIMAQSSIPAQTASVLNGIAQLLGSVLSIFLVDSIGRRILLLLTFGVMSLTMFVYTIYIHFVTNGYATEMIPYGSVPTICLCLFVCMFRLGVSPVPWFMAPEIIPTEAQRWAPSAIVSITWGISFLLSKSFLPAISAFGQFSVYTCFTIICFIGIIYTLIIVPETRNKSREEIQMQLGATKTNSDNENC